MIEKNNDVNQVLEAMIMQQTKELLAAYDKRIKQLEAKEKEKEVWLTINKVVEEFEISRSSVYRGMKLGDFIYRKIKRGRRQVLTSSLIAKQ